MGLLSGNTSVPVSRKYAIQPECVDVGARVHADLAKRDLGRDVAGRARRRALDRQLADVLACGALGQPEVQHLYEVVGERDAAQHDVRGLQVAMDHAAFVSFVKRRADLLQHRSNPPGGLRTECGDERLKANPVEQLHHVVELPIA